MRILVTGASGRIGQWVVRELVAHGHGVRALDSRPLPKDLRTEKIETIYQDVSDPLGVMNAVAGCDTIAHLAAYPGPFSVTAAELLRVNVIGTQNILEAAMAHNISRVVLTSSIGALGYSFPTHPCLPDYLPVDVAHPRRPQDIYGLSKVMNEESAAAASRLSGMSTIVMRPPWVGDLEMAKSRGWLSRITQGSDNNMMSKDLWGYIDCRDMAIAFRLALESSLTGHHIFFTMADDIASNETPLALAEKYLPELAADASRLPSNCFYDLSPIREQLGFSAQYTWRRVLEGD